MGHDRTGIHAGRHDAILKKLDDNDHLTERGGGEHTHGTEAAFKMKEKPERAASEHSGRKIEEPIGPESSGNYGKGASGAHGGKSVAGHGLNHPVPGKKLNK